MLKYPISGSGYGESIRDTERNDLYIGWDDEDGFVMLFTPSMKNTDTHYHIELNKAAAIRLNSFLSKKLKELKRGSATSEKKRAASRTNGKLGGRPKKQK